MGIDLGKIISNTKEKRKIDNEDTKTLRVNFFIKKLPEINLITVL